MVVIFFLFSIYFTSHRVKHADMTFYIIDDAVVVFVAFFEHIDAPEFVKPPFFIKFHLNQNPTKSLLHLRNVPLLTI